MGNRIFYGFLILLFSALLWLLPVTSGIYEFRTDEKLDSFYTETTGANTTANVTLSSFVYDNDTATITILSNLNTDNPTFVSYNTTTRATIVGGLTASEDRTLSVTYDTDALNSDSWDTFLNLFPFIWMVIIICFPVVGLVAILIGG